MTAPTQPLDPFSARRPQRPPRGLEPAVTAGVLVSADVHVAATLARLVDEGRDDVVLATALAVRAVRLGHVYVDLASVAETTVAEDGLEPASVVELVWPEAAAWAARVATSPLVAEHGPLHLDGAHLYLERYWRHERTLATGLLQRVLVPDPPVDVARLDAGLDRLFGHDAPDQRNAARAALTHRLSVIAGGPGTGKTTTVARILALYIEDALAAGTRPPRIGLCAPTGKAAARLTEAVREAAEVLPVADEVRVALRATSASTTHKLLGWQPGRGTRHGPHHPVAADLVVIDECSMVDLAQMSDVVAALPSHARLVLVGDPRQLASVEAGAVFGDIVGPAIDDPTGRRAMSRRVVVLQQEHRFGTEISTLARAIVAGDADAAVALARAGSGAVDWLEVEPGPPRPDGPYRALHDRLVAVGKRLVHAARQGEREAALASLTSLQVLCAHRHGPTGASTWRSEIEHWLRVAVPGYGTGAWYAGRPVLVTTNDSRLGLYNGDTGVVVVRDGRLRVAFERSGGAVDFSPARLSAVDSLQAMTIHKSQGSQFAEVVVVLPAPESRALTRELLYTAVTRARDHLCLVGSEAALRAAIARPIARSSGLASALYDA